jgi:hypothetical protein
MFLNDLEAAGKDATFRDGLPAFVAGGRRLFGPWQPAECPGTARRTEPFHAGTYEEEDPEVVGTGRQAVLRRCAADLLVVERAKELLPGE